MIIVSQPLADIIGYGLKIVFIGYNPGLRSAELGHHYAGRNNRFWSLLYKSGLLSEPLKAEEDRRLLEYGYGSLNIVDRPSRGATELTNEDFSRGREILLNKLTEYQPWIACYLGIGVYQKFAQMNKVERGLQKTSVVPGVEDFVISSPSGLNRTPYEEQLQRYCELKTYIDQIDRRIHLNDVKFL